jgi:hypothetical protein
MKQVNQIEQEGAAAHESVAVEECYDCHEWEYIERLECVSGEYVRELWGCLNCSHTRVITRSIGVRDD